MRFIGANWKMNSVPKGFDLPSSPYRSAKGKEIVVFPSLLDIHVCVKAGLTTGGQCGAIEEKGAYTGDVSMGMLATHGCTHVLCGHSERRTHHEESDEAVAKQVQAAIKAGLTAVICIGENADEREMGMSHEVVERQLKPILKLCASTLTAGNTVIAYEPVWAVGTGKTPTAADVQAAHVFIRKLLPSQDIRIVYGGSVTGKNAGQFFGCADVDGGLIGGAALKPEDFAEIVKAA